MKQNVQFKKFELKVRLILTLLALFISVSGFSQERTITGVITDENNVPLPGVNVVIKGTSTGSVTDIDGKYSIKVPGDETTLSISYIGYNKQEIIVGTQTTINVTLKEETTQLNDVVVIGYGVQKKKLVTGATVQVKSEDLVKNKVVRLESALQGLTPGMLIVKQSGQPGSDFNITIRGIGTVNENKPLVLIDGVPGSMNNLNPSDVESVDVLKDAASAAIYGSRAANGVVLITTKKGKSGQTQITYDGYMGWSNPINKVDLLNAKEYATIMNEEQHNTTPQNALFFTQEYIDGLGKGTDWQEEAMTKNAPSYSHYIGFTGGNETSNYSTSLSYNKEEGVYNFEDKSQFERFGFRLNSEHKLKKFLKVGENLTYTHRTSHALGTGNQYNNFMRDLLSSSPLISVYDEKQPDGYGKSWANENPRLSVPNLEQVNPIASMHYRFNEVKNYDDIVGDIYAEISITEGLKFKTDFGGTLIYNYNTDYRDTFRLTPTQYGSIPEVKQSMNRDFAYNFDNVLSYTKDVGEHNFLFLIGTNAQEAWFYKLNGERKGYLTSSAKVLTNVANGLTLDTAYGDFGKGDARFSYFGRFSYNFSEKYMATVSLRRDASSKFGPNNRVGYFPSVSAGWVVNKEAFLENISAINFLKVRGSWGQNGKEPDDAYTYMATVGSYQRAYTFGTGVSPDRFPNPDIKWEKSEQINFGLDSRFFKNFSFTFDWYKKTSRDWIVQRIVPGISGIAGIDENKNPTVNAGNVINTGVEFDLGYTKNIGDFSFELRGNLSYNKNKVTEVPDSIINGSTSVLYNGSDEFYRVQEGYPIGFFWGFKTAGLFQTQDDVTNWTGGPNNRVLQPNARPGDVKRIDVNNDGILDTRDKVMIGDPNPDYIFGFNVSASYKGLDFAMNIQGQLGNQIVKCYRAEEREYANYTRDILDRWQWNDANNNNVVDPGEGSGNTIPRVTKGTEPNQNWRMFSDLYIHDGDYLRIKSINLGYDFKRSVLKNTPLQQFRLYVAATNILTVTKYDGIDPEIGYGSYYDANGLLRDKYATGVDLGFYPASITYMVGVNVKF